MFDKAVDTLFDFVAAQEALLASVRGVAFFRAKSCPGLFSLKSKQLLCIQTFKPDFDLLLQQGFACNSEVNGKFELCLACGSKQRDENFILFADAIDALNLGGVFLCCLPKELGAARFERELGKVGGELISYSKNHCRVFGVRKQKAHNEAVLSEWRQLARLKLVAGTSLLSRPGIFGWDKIDHGSALLVRSLPALYGKVADLGSGYGFLSQHISESHSDIATLELFEAEKLALDASQASFAKSPHNSKFRFHWHDVTSGLPEKNFDFIVTNPPFHSGKQTNIGLGEKFIQVASQSLKRGGEFFMVANTSLPYERTLKKCFSEFSQVANEKGFKVLKATL
jgi:16S rRNA (guanine1207-N2)-methyltransferase